MQASRRRKKNLIMGAAVALAFAIAVAYVASRFWPVAGPEAPRFVATTTDGEEFVLASHFPFHPVLITFLSVRSTDGQQFLNGTLKDIRTTYAAIELFLLTIDTNPDGQDTAVFVNAYRAAYDMPWPFAIDDGSLRSLYKVETSIGVFLVGKRGQITFAASEPVDFGTIRATVDASRREYAP